MVCLRYLSYPCYFCLISISDFVLDLSECMSSRRKMLVCGNRSLTREIISGPWHDLRSTDINSDGECCCDTPHTISPRFVLWRFINIVPSNLCLLTVRSLKFCHLPIVSVIFWLFGLALTTPWEYNRPFPSSTLRISGLSSCLLSANEDLSGTFRHSTSPFREQGNGRYGGSGHGE